MKPILYLISLVAFPTLFYAQKNQSVSLAGFKPDTIKVYDCVIRVVRQDFAANTYSINGKEVTEQEYTRIEGANSLKKTCNPCYLKTYTLNEKILSEGLYYHVCDSKKEAEVETIKDDGSSTSFRIKSQSCKDGWWLYYDADGHIEKKEKFNKGN